MNEKLRIAQVTDVHLTHFPLSENDKEILADLEAGLRTLNADMIMITGDLVNSYGNGHERDIYKTFFEFLNRFAIPVGITYGNHDSEHEMSRADIDALFLETVALRVERTNEVYVEDFNNYTVEIKNPGSGEVRYVLYVMDSGQVAPGPDRTNDWILPEQVEWFRQTQGKYAGMRHNLVFLHIPLPEYEMAKGNIVSGELREPGQLISHSRINTGLFSELFFSRQIHSVYCGHNHLNNAVMMWEGIQLVYGMFCGKEPKAGDFRGIRYIDLEMGDGAAGVSSNVVFYGDVV
ncbi:metallophosphoesterase [Fundicoccus sp. Sow4_H7]|uniref:metallophosphoesterase n=1 Tax=Fundicoccus sp. Sow4_H7 TaxID=3438784 RepID=UPI003F93D874